MQVIHAVSELNLLAVPNTQQATSLFNVRAIEVSWMAMEWNGKSESNGDRLSCIYCADARSE